MNENLLPEEAFFKITGKRPSGTQLERWAILQSTLDLDKKDSVWSIVIILEAYNLLLADASIDLIKQIKSWTKIQSMLVILQVVAAASLVVIILLKS